MTYAAAGGDGNLHGVTPHLTDILNVKRSVGFNVHRISVDTDHHGGRPVGVHLTVFMVETLQL